MKIGILQVGQVDPYIIDKIQENIKMIFPKAECILINENIQIPTEAFDKTRNQYRSNIILNKIHIYAEKEKTFDRILGVLDMDIFVHELNFVFGEAKCPGRAALISLWRLRPEFYGKPSKAELFVERITKEAVHELGHTLGLRHCSNPFCVMYFSNSIFETDRKQSLFCNKCYLKAEATIKNMGKHLERKV